MMLVEPRQQLLLMQLRLHGSVAQQAVLHLVDPLQVAELFHLIQLPLVVHGGAQQQEEPGLVRDLLVEQLQVQVGKANKNHKNHHLLVAALSCTRDPQALHRCARRSAAAKKLKKSSGKRREA